MDSETEHIATMSSNQVIKAASMFASGGQASKVSVIREIAVASALGLAFGFYWQVIRGGGQCSASGAGTARWPGPADSGSLVAGPTGARFPRHPRRPTTGTRTRSGTSCEYLVSGGGGGEQGGERHLSLFACSGSAGARKLHGCQPCPRASRCMAPTPAELSHEPCSYAAREAAKKAASA